MRNQTLKYELNKEVCSLTDTVTVLVIRRRFSNTIHVVISTVLDRDLVEAVAVVSSVLPANLPKTKCKILYWLETLEEFISSVGIFR